ncbi:hypothetical protein OEZ85_014037 [Tetradesmus obliquus]|uniref:Uncharacterized protein n=1 Tax=Tetradesmus obliquus TaxID=3088 RepID=A0ABY8U7G0_TETOB|nr:hypothetical protein OEZ85_014037 [Tetradesmus obliquus]
MPRVLGGQAFRPSSFPPTKYIESLIRAYCPELQEAFDKERFLEAFNKARHSAFDEEFAKVSRDGVSCGLQLCWCLLDIEPGLTLPLHAHKNLEVAYVLKGVMKERGVSSRIALERLKPSEVDWLDVPASAKVVDASFAAGRCWLGLPGSVHQVYTSKGSEGCMLLMLYSKDCTFIRAASPVISRQLLPSTAEKGTTYHMAPTVRSPASFMSRDPLYAKYRRSGSMRHPAMTVAQVAVKALADCGVRDAILYPGAKCVELLKVVDNNPWGVRGWLCRNEHAGAFMAEAYNKSQGERLCAVMTTSGPGATNLCTGIASAWRDGVPMIVITSQVPTYKQGTAAFQEVPVVELFAPISKGAFYVASAAQVYDTVVSACRLAVSGVNGPVVVDLPEDLQAETVTLPERSRLQDADSKVMHPMAAAVQAPSPSGVSFSSSPGKGAARATVPLHAPNRSVLAPSMHSLRSHIACPISQSLMKRVLQLLKGSQRPLLLLGGGAVRVDGSLMCELVDVLDMPVVYTWMGKGCISDDHELCLGPIGVHGLHTANTAVARCDLLLALGCRFDERSACKAFELWDSPRHVVHVDLTPQKAMSGSPKNVIGCGVEADCEDFVGVLLQHLYGFIEERRAKYTLSTGRSLERLESRGSCKVTELDELAPFLVEEGEEEAMGLTPIPSEREEEGAAGPAENGASGEQLQTPVHTAGSVHEDSILGTVEEGEEEAMGLTPIPSEREEEGAAGPAENGASGEQLQTPVHTAGSVHEDSILGTVEEGEEEEMGLTPIPSEREEEGAAGPAENGASGKQLQTPVHTAGSVHEDSILGTVEEGEEEAMGLTPIPSEREEEGAAGPAENGASERAVSGDISFSFKKRQEAAAAAAADGEPQNSTDPAAAEGPFAAAHAHAANGAGDDQGADVAGGALPELPSQASTINDLSGSDWHIDWHMYSGWSREMADMKQRRWRSMMPISGAQSELTTREMVHVTDSFLSFRGLQPIICSDVGSHQCLLAQYMRVHRPRQWLIEGGLASMGCGLPAAIGAALANPQATCLAICGDGGFAMTSQELMMAKVYKLNVKVIVTVNNRLQLVEQLEEEVYDSLDVFTFLGDPEHPHRPYPNFAKVAEAYGVRSVTAWNRLELLDGLSLMFAHPGPFLLEVVALAERPHIRYWTDDEQ